MTPVKRLVLYLRKQRKLSVAVYLQQ